MINRLGRKNLMLQALRRGASGAVALVCASTSLMTLHAGAASAAGCVLAPTLSDVTINQGLGGNKTLTRGKDALVKLYLSLPACANTTAGDQVTVTSTSTAPTTVSVTAANSATSAVITPTSISMYNQAGYTLGPASGAPYVNQAADPIFLIPGNVLQPNTTTLGFTLTATATVHYTATPGTGSTSTPGSGTITFSTLPNSSSPIAASFEQKTNALRVLVVQMVDPNNANTFNSTMTPNAATATSNGLSEMSRILPLPNGVQPLTCNPTTALDCGGLRWSYAPSTLNLRAVPYTSNGSTTFYNFVNTTNPTTGVQEFCGAANGGILFSALENLRQNWNQANPATPADRVLGVVDEANSLGSSFSTTCPDGMGQLPQIGTLPTNTTTATAAWARACYKICLSTSGGPSITGSVTTMELSHTIGLVPTSRDDTTRHSPNVHADSVPTQTPNRTFYLPNRSPISSGAAIGDSHSVMDYASDATTTWNDTDTLLESLDYGYWQCALGGAVDTECGSLAGTVGTSQGVPAGGLYTITGTVTINASTGVPASANVADSYRAPDDALQTPDAPGSAYQLIQLSGAGGSVCRQDSIGVSNVEDDHSGTTLTQPTDLGQIDAAVPFVAGCTTRVELRYISGSTNVLLYARDTSNGTPQIVPGTFVVSGGVTQAGTYSETSLSPAETPPGEITQGPDGNLWLVAGQSTLVRVTPAGARTDYRATGHQLVGVTNGPDGNVWFTGRDTGTVGNVTPGGTITEYPLPDGAASGTHDIATGPDANLWVTLDGTNKVVKMSPAGTTLAQYPLPTPGSQPAGITTGPDGNVWFTENAAIGRLTPTGTLTEFPLGGSSGATGIALGSDGNLWFTELNTSKVGRITPTGTITEYALSANAAPQEITAGPDGNLWIAESGSGSVARITPGSGTVTEYAAPAGASSAPTGIAAGPDGRLWMTESGAGKLAVIASGSRFGERLTPSYGLSQFVINGPDGDIWFAENDANKLATLSASGTTTEYPLPTANAGLEGIAAGPDGNVWFTEGTANKIGVLKLSNGSIQEFPQLGGHASAFGIVGGPDGNVWFTNPQSSEVGRITPLGVVTYFATPSPNSGPSQLTVGPDGNIWFTEAQAAKVARITPGGVITEVASVGTPGSAQPYAIVTGPDGNLWVSDPSARRVDKVTLSGTVTSYPTASAPAGITAGPDGNVWFVEEASPGYLGFVTPSGSIGELPLPTAKADAIGIVAGEDGNIWYSESNKLGRYSLAGSSMTTRQLSASATTSTGTGLSNLRLDVYYQCPGSTSLQPVTGGLTGQQSGSQVTFTATVDLSPACGGAGTFTAIANDGFTESAPQSAPSASVPNRPPSVAIVNPLTAQTYLQFATIPVDAVARDPQDGDVTHSAQVTLADANGTVVATGQGGTVDLAPPSSGWAPGTYTLTVSATDAAGLNGSSSIPMVVVADGNHNGLADSVEAGPCFPPTHATDPYEPWRDYDFDGIPNIDDPAPCSPASFYLAQEVFNPQTLNVYSNGQATTVDISLTFVAPLGSATPSTVQIERIAGQPVSGYTAIHWSVTGPNTAIAQFSRSTIEGYLIQHNLVNRQVGFQIGGTAGNWSFDGSCSTYASTS